MPCPSQQQVQLNFVSPFSAASSDPRSSNNTGAGGRLTDFGVLPPPSFVGPVSLSVTSASSVWEGERNEVVLVVIGPLSPRRMTSNSRRRLPPSSSESFVNGSKNFTTGIGIHHRSKRRSWSRPRFSWFFWCCATHTIDSFAAVAVVAAFVFIAIQTTRDVVQQFGSRSSTGKGRRQRRVETRAELTIQVTVRLP